MSAVPQQKDLAAALGVDPGLVSRYKRRGMPVDSIEAAMAWKAANVRARVSLSKPVPPLLHDGATSNPGAPSQAAPADPGPSSEYAAMRARRERAEAMMSELDLAKATGSVLDREPALRAIFTKFRELRDTGMVMGRKLAPVLAPMTDEREIRIVIDRAMGDMYERFVQRTLQGLADNLSGGSAQVPVDLAVSRVEPQQGPAAAS